MKKISILVSVLILISIASYVISSASKGESSTKRYFFSTDIASATRITCKYPQVLSVNYRNGQIDHNLPSAEKNAIVFTFSDLDKDIAQLSYIDSTQTISNEKIMKLIDTADRYIFVEGNGENYFTTHTIFKKRGVSVYSKSVDLIGTPSGTLAMGDCVGY